MAAPGPAATTMLGVKAHYNGCVPLKLCQEKIMVDITGPSTERGKTASLDLVLVLDTSESMDGKKLQYMKQAVDFIIRKIGEKDTLTIVPFSDKAEKPLKMSRDNEKPARELVKGLKARGKTNIKDGLRTAVRILRDRKRITGRAAAVFLMSDGKQDTGDAKDVRHVQDFPVFTFGFGQQHNHHLLHDIARRSRGGTYHNAGHSDDTNNQIRHVAKVLAILHDVSALDLTVTLKPRAGATILELKPGNYPKTYGETDGFPIINFGELAREEHRKILVVIVFPPVLKDEKAKNVMTVEWSYRLPSEKKRINKSRLHIEIARRQEPGPHKAPSEHFQVELAHRKQAQRIRYMKKLADDNKFDEVSDVLKRATEDLVNIKSKEDTIKKQLEALRLELEQLKRRLKSQNVYKENRGEAYMLAATLSHERQRFAVRGGYEDVMLYAMTKRVPKYESHVKLFLKNADTTEI